MGIKIWGNHCGPLHGKGDQPATDPVDEACKRHDKGYGKNGYFDLGTDLRLIGDQVKNQFTEDLTLEQRLASVAITVAFVHLLPVSTSVTALREGRDIVEGIASKTAGVFDDAGDMVESMGNAAVGAGKKAWNTVTSIF